MKKISKQFRPHVGPHQIEITDNKNWQSLSGKQPVFIFDFFTLEQPLRYSITSYIAKKSNVNILSTEIIWVDGQDEFLNDEVLSFWLWDQNSLVPFAFVGQESKKGPFNDCDGLLFLNTNTNSAFEKMDVLFFDIKKCKLTRVADSLGSLKIIKKTPNRVLSEQIKQEGNILFGQEKFEKASEKFYEAMITDTTNPNPYNNISMISQVTGTMPKRGEFFSQLSFLTDPKYTNGMRGYSSYLATQGNFKRAVKLMSKCVTIEPSAQNYAILSEYYFDSGKHKKAQQAFDKGSLLNPKEPILLKVKEKIDFI